MRELLLTIDEISVYENDMVRYYTDDLSTIQFGLAIKYDSFENRLTVRAITETLVNPVNIIEVYTEEEWQHITFDKYDDYVNMNIYPFHGGWAMIEKKGRTNKVLVELPYTKYSTFSWARLEEIGLEQFEEQLQLTAINILNTEIMEFSFNTTEVDEAASMKIIRNLPYTGQFEIETESVMGYTSMLNFKTWLLNQIEIVISAKILNEIHEEIVDLDKLTRKVSNLPYTVHETISFSDILENSGEVRRSTEYNAISLIQTDLMDLLNEEDNNSNFVVLPHREYGDFNMDTIWDYGLDYFYEGAINYARKIINGKLVRKYVYSNGTTIVMDLPWIEKWTMSMWDIMRIGKEETERLTIEHILNLVNIKANTFKYGIVITKDKFNMAMYIYGAPLMEIADDKLKDEIIEHFEEIIANLNMNYWNIKTIEDMKGSKVSVNLPIVETLEKVENECNSQRDIYRVFIRYSNSLFRAYLLVSNKKLFKGVTIASPHIYSQNSIVLAEVEGKENPMKYEEEYLKYLVNNRRNDVIDMVEAEAAYQ